MLEQISLKIQRQQTTSYVQVAFKTVFWAGLKKSLNSAYASLVFNFTLTY